MEDEFPNFSLGFIEKLEMYFLCDLHNEEENELLAAVYREANKYIKKEGELHFFRALALPAWFTTEQSTVKV